MDIQSIIKLKPTTVQFLVMALLAETFSTEGMNLFKRLFHNKINEDAIKALKMSTNVVVNCDSVLFEGKLQLHCSFKGHGGYPGGSSDKDLGKHVMMIEPTTLVYLMHEMLVPIEEEREALKKVLASDNIE